MHRILLGLVVVSAAVVVPAGPAGAATSASCPAAQSTRLVTATVLGDPSTETRLWVYSPSSTQTIVCFVLPDGSEPTGGGAIVINGTVSVSPPSVTPGTDLTKCTLRLVDVSDPVSVHLAVGASGTTLCIAANNSATTLTVDLGVAPTVPSVELWRDGTWGLLDIAVCLPLYPADSYFDCVNTPGRVV